MERTLNANVRILTGERDVKLRRNVYQTHARMEGDALKELEITLVPALQVTQEGNARQESIHVDPTLVGMVALVPRLLTINTPANVYQDTQEEGVKQR